MSTSPETIPDTVTCPRCKRPAVGWPLKRPDICSPKDWVHCIRDPFAILAKEAAK